MATTIKTIRGIDQNTLDVIEKRGEKLGVSSNELIRTVLDDYAKRIQEIEASEVLHAQIDDLIAANNELIDTQNQNTLVMGELTKNIISRLDFYLPFIDTNDIKKSRRHENKGAVNPDKDNYEFT
ncbi:hypothetical protein LNP18_06560 [Leuconostoc citreum]|uniref:hypothetical protein n=1 Tax=Leuconostoc citreum TaxID=33964 RepID=UPI00200A32D9|nr:hypothetical protein [Leuconostoc citreum]MCK8605766.1 hypothetical protein [Leuconostoc citreum]